MRLPLGLMLVAALCWVGAYKANANKSTAKMLTTLLKCFFSCFCFMAFKPLVL